MEERIFFSRYSIFDLKFVFVVDILLKSRGEWLIYLALRSKTLPGYDIDKSSKKGFFQRFVRWKRSRFDANEYARSESDLHFKVPATWFWLLISITKRGVRRFPRPTQ